MSRLVSDPDRVSITAHPAGRTVGGTMWEIRRGGESMLYAVGYNHRRELHLEGCKFGLFKRPSVVITECNTLQNVSSKKQHQVYQCVCICACASMLSFTFVPNTPPFLAPVRHRGRSAREGRQSPHARRRHRSRAGAALGAA
jgi:hypothetical protein